jgi:hypothetical protein
MAAGVTDKLWEISDMVKVLEDWETQKIQINRADHRAREDNCRNSEIS